MLQQTQVKTVLPYWERWMVRFPTITSLASADLSEVLKHWEGLGYYSRARNAHRAAHIILRDHGALFPDSFDALMALPGIGRYTAGAIASIAFNQPKPIVDGNIVRVLARLFAIRGSPVAAQTKTRFWKIAESLVTTASHRTSGQPCSEVNQSLMELGALVCLPRNPACAQCPLNRFCAAFTRQAVHQFPTPTSRAAAVPRRFVAFALQFRETWLVRQRPPLAVNGLLWEFPNCEWSEQFADPLQAARECLSFSPGPLQFLTSFQHSITRFRIDLTVYTAQVRSPTTVLRPSQSIHANSNSNPADLLNTQWLTLDQMRPLAFPSAHRKILLALSAQVGQS